MAHVNCSASLCYDNFRKRDKKSATAVGQNKTLQFYPLPRVEKDIQVEYQRILKTVGLNWKKGFICNEHWSSGERKDISDLPDVPVPASQFEEIKTKHKRAKKKLDQMTKNNKVTHDPSKIKAVRRRFNAIDKKLKTATTILHRQKNIVPTNKVTKKLNRYATKKATKNLNNINTKSPDNGFIKLSGSENCNELKTKVLEANTEISRLQKELKNERDNAFRWEMSYLKTFGQLADLESHEFTYTNLKKFDQKFSYVCGLSVSEFDIVMECLEPYTHLLKDCGLKTVSSKTYDLRTQFLIVLTICRHAIDIKFMAFILNTSESIVQRLFSGWSIFTASVFNKIDLRPGHGFLLQKMPESFVTTGHGHTDLVIDATEFKFQCATNYEINSLMFSHYKNTHTGKALIGIAAHGMGILFSDVYPGSISDSDITEKAGILNLIEEEHELMSDRGFAVQELCSIKGIFLNRPKQKDEDQFTQQEVHRNFDIASTRIHVERFIGRVRDWRILNKVWPMNQMDLLSPVWQMLCHVVNLVLPPIGPKEEK